MNNDIYEETRKIIEIATQIIENPDLLIETIFNNTLFDLLAYTCRVGTLAHISIYLREIEYLKQLIDRFDDPKKLYDWLSITDSNKLTVSDLVLRYDYPEFVILFENLTTNKFKSEVVLKKGFLDKYTNVMNGFRPRYVVLTTKYLAYGKNSDQIFCQIPLNQLNFEYSEDFKKFKLTKISDETELIFKDLKRETLIDWIDFLKNVMPNRDKSFYFNSFFYKLIGDIAISSDTKLYEIMKSNNTLTYYLSSQHTLVMTSESELILKSTVEENSLEKSIEQLKIKRKSQEDLEMYSLDSEEDEEFDFYEAK